ncbi:hypothetical protein RFI_16675 [Reticulomyxa filosa]|uniref:Uncharacterized protein n=1 Tax=Reticulomyxa filosa TaxID=46433 RepID=X6N2P8_RETFI|nr:hypothetical protein RFI_16675 [Reticulomyxa filosa]|eukprot:ETO20540.1 hypothetical protein RFI_16675 [Reticulomyxa filosa]
MEAHQTSNESTHTCTDLKPNQKKGGSISYTKQKNMRFSSNAKKKEGLICEFFVSTSLLPFFYVGGGTVHRNGKFSYDADVNSLTANIDIDKLTSESAANILSGSTNLIDYDHMDDLGINALSVQSDLFAVSGIATTSASASATATIATSVKISDDDDGIGSLFDDPDLLKVLPTTITSFSPSSPPIALVPTPVPTPTSVTVSAITPLASTPAQSQTPIQIQVQSPPFNIVQEPVLPKSEGSSFLCFCFMTICTTANAIQATNEETDKTVPRIVVTNENNKQQPILSPPLVSITPAVMDNINSVPANTDSLQLDQHITDKAKEKEKEEQQRVEAEAAHRFVNNLKSIDTTRLTKNDIDQYKEELQQKKLVSTFAGLKSIDTLSTNELETHKAEILHRKLVSESEYAVLLENAQSKGAKDDNSNATQVQLNEEEKQRINSAKEKFRQQSGTEFLFMPSSHSHSDFVRPAHFDLKADVEHNKDADLLLRQENQHKLQEVCFFAICI